MFTKFVPAIAIALLLIGAACSSGDSTSSTTPTPTAGGGGATTSAATSSAAGSGNAGATTPASATTTASGAAGVLDPCALVTQQEVAAAVGEPVGAGVSQNDGLICQWEYADPSDALSGVGASLTIDTDSEAFREEQQGAPGTTAVSGVGDEAYFQGSSLASILTFRKGDQLFDVGMNVAGNVKQQLTVEAQEAAEKQIALAAIARIP